MVIDDHEVKLYLNSQLISIASFNGQLRYNDAPIVVGKLSYNSRLKCYFNGKIDEFAIFSKGLTQQEIEALYNRR